MKADPRGRVVRRRRAAGGQGQPARRAASSAWAVTLMRLVFAGTPGRRAARAGRDRRLPARAGRRGDPARRAGRPRPAPGPLAGRRAGPTSAASRCSPRPRPARAGVPGPAARARARTACRSSPTARWCRRPRWRSPARLGQPALLAAAGLAGRGAGAARRAARRRDHRRQRLPAGGGPGHRPGLRHADRDDPAHRHLRRPARPARRPRAPGCWSRCSTRSRPAPRGPCRSRPTASRWRPKLTVEDARGPLGRPGVRGRPPGPGLHAGARAPGPRSAATGSSSARCRRSPTRRRSSPGELLVEKHRVLVGTATDAGGARRGPGGRARSRCRPPTGPAACASAPGERFG